MNAGFKILPQPEYKLNSDPTIALERLKNAVKVAGKPTRAIFEPHPASYSESTASFPIIQAPDTTLDDEQKHNISSQTGLRQRKRTYSSSSSDSMGSTDSQDSKFN